MVYELLLVTGIVLLAGLIFDFATDSRHALRLREFRFVWLMSAVGIYFVWCWHIGGQTLAMKTWLIKLVEPGRTRPQLWKLIARFVLCWPVGLIGGMVAVGTLLGDLRLALWWPVAAAALSLLIARLDPRRQFLHDRLLGLQLVHTPKPPKR